MLCWLTVIARSIGLAPSWLESSEIWNSNKYINTSSHIIFSFKRHIRFPFEQWLAFVVLERSVLQLRPTVLKLNFRHIEIQLEWYRLTWQFTKSCSVLVWIPKLLAENFIWLKNSWNMEIDFDYFFPFFNSLWKIQWSSWKVDNCMFKQRIVKFDFRWSCVLNVRIFLNWSCVIKWKWVWRFKLKRPK